MARITIEDCLRQIQNRLMVVRAVTARVRQLRAGDEPLVHSPKNEDIVVALREIAAGKINVEREESEQA
jgi:DNA-directed RNA polymerase subunit omega